jgi:hypothetical protein
VPESARGQFCALPNAAVTARAAGRQDGNGGIPGFSTLGTARAEQAGTGNKQIHGSKTMDKFETYAFAFGFVATAFITMVALPLA